MVFASIAYVKELQTSQIYPNLPFHRPFLSGNALAEFIPVYPSPIPDPLTLIYFSHTRGCSFKKTRRNLTGSARSKHRVRPCRGTSISDLQEVLAGCSWATNPPSPEVQQQEPSMDKKRLQRSD